MLIKMLRTQRTIFGMLHEGVAYDVKAKNKDQEKVLETLLKREFAEKTTEAKLAADKAAAEKSSAKNSSAEKEKAT